MQRINYGKNAQNFSEILKSSNMSIDRRGRDFGFYVRFFIFFKVFQ